jgi:hypothetical protein
MTDPVGGRNTFMSGVLSGTWGGTKVRIDHVLNTRRQTFEQNAIFALESATVVRRSLRNPSHLSEFSMALAM